MKDVFRQVKRKFIWMSDQENYGIPEHWKSYADEVQGGQVFQGDCDNFALTCAELLLRNRVDTRIGAETEWRPGNNNLSEVCCGILNRYNVISSGVRLAFCFTEAGEGHLVCVAKDRKGKDMVLDNRQRGVWHWTQIRYNWISSMRLDEPGVWRSSK